MLTYSRIVVWELGEIAPWHGLVEVWGRVWVEGLAHTRCEVSVILEVLRHGGPISSNDPEILVSNSCQTDGVLDLEAWTSTWR